MSLLAFIFNHYEYLYKNDIDVPATTPISEKMNPMGNINPKTLTTAAKRATSQPKDISCRANPI